MSDQLAPDKTCTPEEEAHDEMCPGCTTCLWPWGGTVVSDLRILVTGSREWTDRREVYMALMDAIGSLCPPGAGSSTHPLTDMTLIHGGARGLDTLAAEQAEAWGMKVEEHRADWNTHGKAAGHRRNAEMVAAGADICLAFPIGESRGTRGCIALAEKAGIPVVIHEGAVS